MQAALENYIPVKLDTDVREQLAQAQKYFPDFRSIPDIRILDPDGEEIYQRTGDPGTAALEQALMDYSAVR